jgi:peptidoglycan hydrolase-like protein with peptidoglycan-binding domain
MTQNIEVRCLQEFLKNQGQDIYPEGLVTGNFLFLTQTAVIRFQEKYALEILVPIGLQKGTGYVGLATRAKLNKILEK